MPYNIHNKIQWDANHEVPHYAIFPISMLLPPKHPQSMFFPHMLNLSTFPVLYTHSDLQNIPPNPPAFLPGSQLLHFHNLLLLPAWTVSVLSCTWDSVHTLLMRLLISPHFLISNWKLFCLGLSTARGSPMPSVFIPQRESKTDLHTYIKTSHSYIVICLAWCFHGFTHSLQANTRTVYERKTNVMHLYLINLFKLPYFSIDNAHPKLFRHSFWCIDNAHDVFFDR